MSRPVISFAVATLVFLGATAFAADESAIDFERAKQLNQRSRQGEKLTAEEQAYLDRARKLREQKGPSSSTTKPGEEPSRAGLKGDDAHVRSRISPIKISAESSPVEKFVAQAEDGRDIRAYYRKPPGDGPFPAVICLHGGVESVSDGELNNLLLMNPTYTRLLARGFVVIGGDYRTYTETPKSRGPVLDCLAIVEHVKQVPAVDRDSVVIFGGSGGGSLALECAAETKLAAIVCGEPATLLFCGMLENGEFGQRMAVLQNPQARWTPERQATTREKIKRISCPVLILHGDKHGLKTLNGEIFVPELKAAGVEVQYKVYPGMGHGFYWGGGGADEKIVEQFLVDVDGFLANRLKTPPKALE